jgi:hypothetical protein
MEAYRRIATAATPQDLHKVSTDLREAYGEPPKAVQRLIDLAEVRIFAAGVGVRTIAVRGADLLLRTENPAATGEQLRRAHGPTPREPQRAGRGMERPDGAANVRILPPPGGEGLHEVYFRPPPNALEPETLLAILRKRLRPEISGSAANDSAPIAGVRGG